ncbi:MAG: alanine racemase [Clostridia bacterium]|nr:alanine racemase [Clostridia bacterium]
MKKLVIEKEKIVRNIQKLKSITNSTIIATLKNNGYGLGLDEFPKLLAECGIDYFAVATLKEAITLRENGITNKIMMLHSTAIREELLALIEYNILPAVGSFSALNAIYEIAKANNIMLEIQLKIDTGFGRFGFLPEEIPLLTQRLKEMNNLRVAGTFSHFSMAFNQSSDYTAKQFTIFNKCTAAIEDAGIEPGVRHICNSSAFLLYPHMHLDAVRIGSALIGRILTENTLNLEKVDYLTEHIEDIKTLPKDHYIGYSNTYKTTRETKIGIVPLGYLDGFGLEKTQDCFGILDTLREIYNKLKNYKKQFFLSVGEKKVPVLGKIGTNNIIIDLTDTTAEIGQEVRIEVNPMLVNPTISRVFI